VDGKQTWCTSVEPSASEREMLGTFVARKLQQQQQQQQQQHKHQFQATQLLRLFLPS
jgi:hypothetical protein